jgi:PIN domain
LSRRKLGRPDKANYFDVPAEGAELDMAYSSGAINEQALCCRNSSGWRCGDCALWGWQTQWLAEKLLLRAQPLGLRLKWIKISGQGPNALNFHIANYLGQELASSPALECAIFSRDTGFDPLVRYLQALVHTCRRVSSLKDAFPAQKRAAIMKLMVARGGIEPPTRGFSVQSSKPLNSLVDQRFPLGLCEIFCGLTAG